MNDLFECVKRRGWGRRAGVPVLMVVLLGVLSACDSDKLLSVDLPSELTDAALRDPDGVETMLNSVFTHFERGYNVAVWMLHGREDGGEITLSSPGTRNTDALYDPVADWLNELMTSRRFANVLRGEIENNPDWSADRVPGRDRFKAIASIYSGAALGLLGSALCEMAVDGGTLMSPAETLAMAQGDLSRALSEIEAVGDFALPHGISSSARNMALGLRAQARWMAGDLAGARADAELVPKGFMAFATREASPGRRNRAAEVTSTGRIHTVNPVIDWWAGLPNPVTGQPWPRPIPFTGYQNLGILPDGRAVRDDGLPIRTGGLHRTVVEDTAVPDTRVETIVAEVAGGVGQEHVANRYKSDGDPIPIVNWKELWLIRAEIEGGQAAIDLVNEVRAEDGLPLVTYADPGNAEQIRYMLIEERRRALYLEGRYFFTKLKNLDILWFPRDNGTSRHQAFDFLGGVRFVMPDDEFTLNPNLSLSDKATLCEPNERPVNVG